MKKAYFLILAAAIVSVWFLTSCGDAPHAPKAAESTPIAVRTVTAATAEWPSIYEAIGTVRARTAATISSKVMGYVREVRVQVGDRVQPGQTLVLLDSRDLEAAYRQAQAARQEARSAMAEVNNAIAAAKAQLDLAQITFKRMKDLFDKRSISNQEFDEAEAKVKMAQANHEMALSKRRQLQEKIQQAEQGVESARIMRSYAEIQAPFAGTVTEKMVDPGNLAAPGAPLLTIEQEGSYRLEVSLEESRLPAVRIGQPVAVSIDALDKSLPARVSEVVPAVDAASRAFVVKINLPSLPQLRSGLFGRARFETGTRQVLAISGDAIVARGQVLSVFVVEDGYARSRLVTVGEHRDNQTEVLSGLSAGDQLVVPRPVGLSDGARVEVRQ
jgi:RND family efflux transporter MFP subunit